MRAVDDERSSRIVKYRVDPKDSHGNALPSGGERGNPVHSSANERRILIVHESENAARVALEDDAQKKARRNAVLLVRHAQQRKARRHRFTREHGLVAKRPWFWCTKPARVRCENRSGTARDAAAAVHVTTSSPSVASKRATSRATMRPRALAARAGSRSPACAACARTAPTICPVAHANRWAAVRHRDGVPTVVVSSAVCGRPCSQSRPRASRLVTASRRADRAPPHAATAA